MIDCEGLREKKPDVITPLSQRELAMAGVLRLTGGPGPSLKPELTQKEDAR